MMTFPEFETFLKESFPEVSAEASERFRMMEAGYTEWNARINVISRKDIGSLYDHHVLHSLAIAEYLRTRRPETYSSFLAPDNGTRILDLGTGGGFPGIPLAVMFPGARFTLCDSVGKKTIVAREISNMLGLGNVEIVNARAESLNEKFDFVVSRAVASLTDFYPWVKGRYSQSILYLKGGEINEEICALMSRERLRKGSISTWQIGNWLKDSYFEGKFVVDISR
ncbi:MAG: 16S rRNA (guanine(527)-N(7))-methyltransferase RsmG [Alistipes sp.]|nr:16S rRNA (guanine(527)-N(7))-methyltransferase RsmG [Alistipes sp.]MDY5199865.1 16S rRNA (guanine(527)-N(7))-methyltransferase RsmG [Candidatus Cryptobacteroides sp.]